MQKGYSSKVDNSSTIAFEIWKLCGRIFFVVKAVQQAYTQTKFSTSGE